MIAVLSVSAVAIAALLAVGWVVATADSAPNLSQLSPRHANPPTEIFAADGTPLGYVHTNTVFEYAAPNQIPTRLRQATVAIEDRRFYQHGALDYQGIVRAGVKDLLGDSGALQGASTLTMQLVNNMFIPESYRAHRDLKYKIVQAKLAEQLEAKHSKSWILDSYLNAVPYGTSNGEEAIGVGAAALMFFNRPVSKLNLAQMSLLAGLPQSPTQYDPLVYPKLAKARRNNVLQAMVKSDYITQGLATAVEKQPLQVHPNNRYIQRSEPYIFDDVEQQLRQRFGANTVDNGGLKVYTTIDPKVEQEAITAVVDHEGGPVLNAQPAAALASVNPVNGNVVAIASSATYGQTNFDFPVQAERQTGSAFKVFALMTLIHDYDGDPNQTYYTSKFLPAGWNSLDPTWSVHTAEETYQGVINITKATTVSDNTVFAQLAEDLGYGKLDATAHAMGITSELTGNPSEVIGGLSYCCTMLEMADAYATLANGGTHVPTTVISKVVFPDGKVVNLGNPPHNRVFSDGEAYEGTQVLKTVIQERDRNRRQLRLSGRGQDRHRQQPGQRLVRRLHAQAVDRGVGRISAGQHRDVKRIRRHAGRSDLARLHAEGLATVTAATSRSRPTRSSGRRSPARIHRPRSRRRPRPSPDRTQLNNPTLFAQPTTPTTTTQTGGATVPGGGLTGGGGGNGGGHGGGHGHHHG